MLGFRLLDSPARRRAARLAFAAFVPLLLGAGVASAQAVWSRVPPPTITNPIAGIDSVHHRFLLFGGVNNRQVWGLSLAPPYVWGDLHATGGPPDQSWIGNAIVDPFADRLLFVPIDATGTGVWHLPLGGASPAWSAVATTGTAPGILAGVVYDRGSNRLVAWECASDTSVYQLALGTSPAVWSRITVTGASSGLCLREAVYDPKRNRVVAFDRQGHVWTLPLNGTGAWSQIFPVGTSPGAREYRVTYDPLGDRVLVGGGGSVLLWGLVLSGTPAWQMISSTADPAEPTDVNALAYDPVDQRVITYGFKGEVPNVTDAYDLDGLPTTWSRLTPPTQVIPKAGFQSTRLRYDPVRDRLLWFENYTFDNGGIPRIWEHRLGEYPQWRLLPQAGAQPPRLIGSAIVYDLPRDRFLYFGGNDGTFSNAINDVWALDPSTTPATWTHLSPTGTPPPSRANAGAIYDPVRDRLVIFGGQGVTFTSNDAWALSLAGTPAWSPLTTSGTPPSPRASMFTAYDPRRDLMLLFGGSGNQDAWTLSLGATPTWTMLTPSGAPGAPGGRWAWDAVRDRLLVADVEFEPVRALTGGAVWSDVPTVGIAPFFSVVDAFDPRRDRWIAFENDLRTLSFGGVTLASVRVPPPTVWASAASLPLTYVVRNPLPYAQTFAWSLASERNWPGMPQRGVVTVPAQDSADVLVSVPVPDTVAVGLNNLTFFATGSSPLVTAVGTHHLHDATTPTAVALVAAEASPERVRLTWWLADASSAGVERRESGAAWQAIGFATGDDGLLRFEDAGVVAGRHYSYRLRLGPGADEVGGEVGIDVPNRWELALRRLGAYPGAGLSLAITLPAAGSATLEVIDVSGRRCFAREVGSDGPGRHSVTVAAAEQLAPGVYLLRLTQAGRSVTGRAVMLR